MREHLEWCERTRDFCLRLFDWVRALFTVPILVWPAVLSVSADSAHVLLQTWFWSAMLVSVALTLWVELRRKELIALSLKVSPFNAPDRLRQAASAPWPICFQPSAPMMVLKGARGNSLNVGHAYVFVGAAYLTDMSALLVLLRTQP